MPEQGALAHFREKYRTSEAAGHYARNRFRSWRRAWLDRRERGRITRIVARLGGKGVALDAPCGAGRLLRAFAVGWPHPTIGLDGSMAMLEEVKRGGMKSCLLVQGDMRALPFRDNAFEGVLCIRILHRVPESLERRELLEEVIRVSRRWVVTSFYDSNTPHAARKKERGRYDGITREVFRSEVESLGWGVTQYWGMRRFWRAHSQTLALLEVLKADEGVRSSD